MGTYESLPGNLQRFAVCIHGVQCKECCWLWKGGKDRYGYGKVHYMGYQIAAHRAIYMAVNSVLLVQKEFILHTCDKPDCCNWSHLYVGTQKRNVTDAIERKRFSFHPENLSSGQNNLPVIRGIEQSQAKMTDRKVRAARLLYNTGEWTQAELCGLFHVGKSVMQRIVTNEDWKHVC